MRTGPTNIQMRELIDALRKKAATENVALWARIANDLEKPTRQRRVINLYKISKFAKDNETIVVPGKVLGSGAMDKKITIAAWSFSEGAADKMKPNGKAITITELMNSKVKPSEVRILG